MRGARGRRHQGGHTGSDFINYGYDGVHRHCLRLLGQDLTEHALGRRARVDAEAVAVTSAPEGEDRCLRNRDPAPGRRARVDGDRRAAAHGWYLAAQASGRADHAERATQLALLERGPTQVNIPRDYFYGEFDATIPKPLPLERAAGSSSSLDQAAKALADAKFPVVIAGGGVVMSNGRAEAIALAEHLSAPVVTSYLHNDSFPASHPLMCGPLGYQGSKAAMKIIAQADVVLALGTRLGPFGTLPQYGIDYWPKNAQIVQVDTDHKVLGLVKPVSVAVIGDARLAAGEILHRLKTSNQKIAAHDNRDQRLAEVARQKKAWEDELNTLSSVGGSPIAPRRALRELEKAMPRNAVVTTDIGNVCSVSNSYLRFEEIGRAHV